jgi:hypothetical protein
LTLREQIGQDNVRQALSLFVQLSMPNSTLICSDLTEMLALAERIEVRALLKDLSFSDKYLFTCAPVSSVDAVIDIYMDWITAYCKGEVTVLKKESLNRFSHHLHTNNDSILNEAENCVKMLVLYHWLARKKPDYFPSLTICEELREQVNAFIENSLKKKGLHRKCSGCSKALPAHHIHKMCDRCFRAERWLWEEDEYF